MNLIIKSLKLMELAILFEICNLKKKI